MGTLKFLRAAALSIVLVFPQVASSAGLDAPGVHIGGDASTNSVTPTSGVTAQTLATIAAQPGVALDAFFQAGDVDYSAALTRACAADVAILLRPTTYTVNNFSGCSGARFIMRGIPGKSTIQRTAASGSNFVTIGAALVYIDGVIFDSNKASVTANQWGVLLSAGGQTVVVRNSAFKNNSGSLGACFALLSTGPGAGGSFEFINNEVTGCASQGAYFGSVSNGLIEGNYFHDNAAWGAFVGSYLTASATNYVNNVRISNNRIMRNVTGLAVGGIAAPYVYGTPAATYVASQGNIFQDNSGSNLVLQGDYLSSTGDTFNQSNPGVTVTNTGIDHNGRYGRISNATMTLTNASFGIDTGGSIETAVTDNAVTMTSGSALNIGGSIRAIARRNRIDVSGSAHAVTVYETETDGNGVPFPLHNSGTDIEDNDIGMSGGSAGGVSVFDDAGGATGATPTVIKNNRFTNSGGAFSSNAIQYTAGGAAISLGGNTFAGTGSVFLNPNGNNDLIPDQVYDGVSMTAGASTTVRSLTTPLLNSYNAGGSILWVFPSAGGSAYTAATTLGATCSGSGPTGWAATPLISQGVIVGVRVTNVGSLCVGTPTVTATDSGGGSGATFTATSVPALPDLKITVKSGTVVSLIQASGGSTQLLPAIPMVVTHAQGQLITFTSNSGAFWNVSQSVLPAFTITTLPPSNNFTCSASYSGVQVQVTNSATGKGTTAHCNGTNWLWPDGTIVS